MKEDDYKILTRVYENLAKSFMHLEKRLDDILDLCASDIRTRTHTSCMHLEKRLDDILDALTTKGPVGSLEDPGSETDHPPFDDDDFADLEKSCGDVLPVEITRVRIG